MSESVVAEVPDTRLMNIFHDVPNRPLLHYRFRPKTCGHAGGGGTRSHWDHGQCPCVPKECGHKYEWNHPYDEQMTLHKPPFSVLDRGKVVNVGRGKFTSYRVGDATNYSKDIHPEYCKKLFSKHYHRNGSLWHPGGVAGTDSDHKLLDLKVYLFISPFSFYLSINLFVFRTRSFYTRIRIRFEYSRSRNREASCTR